MGVQSKLIKITQDTSEEIFKVSNSVPLFWLNLLDLNTIENFEKNYMDSCNNGYLSLKISKKVFIINLFSGKNFIETYYTERINLYNDFINYFDKTFCENDILELNISQLDQFDGINNLLKTLKRIIKNIKLNINKINSFSSYRTIYSFIGFDKYLKNEFKNYSKDYLEHYIKEEIEHERIFKELSKKFIKK